MSDPRSLDNVVPDTPSHAANGDGPLDRNRLADTSRDGSTRLYAADPASYQVWDFTSESQGAETGDGYDRFRINTPDPWSIQAPIGGTPDPDAGRPRQ